MTLSVCMIVKDEEETLARCLNCVAPFADEIIIVDTGSTDDTVAIAKKYTDRVYFFEWRDDFAAARNYSFSKATCDLVMWLDADDVITEENAAKITELKNRDDYDVAFLKYAASFDGDKPVFVYYRERIFRRQCGFKWEGEVHEVVAASGRIVYSPACVYHNKVKRNQPMRNLGIYQRLISRGVKLGARQKFYYGRELFFNNMLTECVAVLSDFLKGDGWAENKVEACRTLYRAYMRLGDENAAVNALVTAFTVSYPRAEDCCALARFFEGKNDVRSAIYWYERALGTAEKEEDGGFINTDYLIYIPAISLCVLYDKAGDYSLAQYYNELAGSVKPDDASYLYNKKYFQTKLTER